MSVTGAGLRHHTRAMGTVLNFADSLRNLITGAGSSRDPRTANAYTATCMTQGQIDQAYRGSGLMRKIIQIPALDMVREWRDWKLDADQITLVEAAENKMALRQKVRSAEVLRGLGGGALILGLPGNPSEPAPKPSRNCLSFVHVVSRWHLSFEQMQLDARLPGYGEPVMWRMYGADGNMVTIHPSRVVPFRADTASLLAAPFGLNSPDAFWGESTVAQVLEAVSDSDAARGAFAAMLNKARVLRIGIPGLGEALALPNGKTLLQGRMENLALAESMFNAMLYDAGHNGENGEEITDAVYNFAGARDIINAYGEFVAAVSDIPTTRLLGRAPEGMNSSGESQQVDWRKKVRAMQTLDLAPCLERVDPFLLASALGSVPDGQWYDFAPLDTPGEAENAARFDKQMDAVTKLQNTGAIPDQAFAKAVQSLMTEEGYLPGLEQALEEIPEAERYGIEPDLPDETLDPVPPADDPAADPALADAAPRTLYVSRALLNADEFIAWAKAQGFKTTLAASDLHVTVAYSRQPVDWMEVEPSWDGEKGDLSVPPGGARLVEQFDGGAIVLMFTSATLAYRHEAIRRAGASWDHPDYQPHITISYDGDGVDLKAIEPYRGPLHFGPEIFEELDEGWQAKIAEE